MSWDVVRVRAGRRRRMGWVRCMVVGVLGGGEEWVFGRVVRERDGWMRRRCREREIDATGKDSTALAFESRD